MKHNNKNADNKKPETDTKVEAKSPVSGYIPFGWYLTRLRESRGIRSEQVAEYLGAARQEYLKIEHGIRLPDTREMRELSRFFKESIAKMEEVALHARRKIFREEVSISGARALSGKLEEAWGRVQESYKEETGRDMIEAERKILGFLKRDLYHLVTPPVTPFPAFLVLDAIKQSEDQYNYLHEIKDFVLPGETAAAFIARDQRLGPSLWRSANLFFFPDNPSPSLVDCQNRLTIPQFKELFLLETFEEGIYSNERELPAIWEQSQHTTICALIVRAFKEHLPKGIDFNHLEMAVLLQGLGHQALYTCLQPSLRFKNIPETDDIETSVSDVTYNFLNEKLFTIMLFELHPVAAAMVAANWSFPRAVVDALLTHHHLPLKDVTPLCSWVKFVNYLAAMDMPVLKKEDIEKFTSIYTQVEIPPESVHAVLVKLNHDKVNFMERSSLMAAGASKSVGQYVRDKLQDIGKKAAPPAALRSRPVTGESLFRDENFHKAASVAGLALFDRLLSEIMAPREKERMKDYLNRIQLFHLRRAWLKDQNLQAIAQTYDMPEADIRKLLNIR